MFEICFIKHIFMVKQTTSDSVGPYIVNKSMQMSVMTREECWNLKNQLMPRKHSYLDCTETSPLMFTALAISDQISRVTQPLRDAYDTCSQLNAYNEYIYYTSLNNVK